MAAFVECKILTFTDTAQFLINFNYGKFLLIEKLKNKLIQKIVFIDLSNF